MHAHSAPHKILDRRQNFINPYPLDQDNISSNPQNIRNPQQTHFKLILPETFYIFVSISIYLCVYIYILMNQWTFKNETEISNLVELITII